MTVTVTYFKAGLGKTVVGIVLDDVEVLSYDETARRASEKVSKDLNFAMGLAITGALLIVLFFIPFLLRRRPSADGRDPPLMLDKFIVWDGVNRPAEGETDQEQFERQSYWLANERRGSFEEKPQLLDIEEAPITANGYRQRAAKAIEAAEEIERQLAALAAGEQLNVGRKLSTGLKFIVWDGVNRPAEGMTNEEFLRRYRWPRWPQWGKRRRRYIGVTLLNLEEAPRWANRDRENAAKAIAVAEDIERQFAALQAKPGSGCTLGHVLFAPVVGALQDGRLSRKDNGRSGAQVVLWPAFYGGRIAVFLSDRATLHRALG